MSLDHMGCRGRRGRGRDLDEGGQWGKVGSVMFSRSDLAVGFGVKDV